MKKRTLQRLQAAAADPMSFSEIRETVCDAICARAGQGSCCYIIDIYPDSVVYQLGSDDILYQCSYAIVDEVCTLGDAVTVEREVTYVPLSAASRIMAAVGAAGDDAFGYSWDVQIVEYGLGKDGRINWPREPLVAAIPLYEGARVFALNDSQHQAANKPFGKSVKEIVGWLENVSDTGTGLVGRLQVLKSARWLRDMLVDSFDRGKPDLLGLSHDVAAIATTKLVAGKKVKEPTEVKSVQVDVVYDPTNNGKFLRMAAAAQAGREEEEMFQRLLAALQGKRPDLYAQITAGIAAGTMTEDQALDQIAAATIKDAGGDAANEQLVAAVVKGIKDSLGAGDSDQLKEMKLVACSMTLRDELAVSKLPEKAQDSIRKQFEGQVFETAALQAAIKTMKELVDEVTGSGRVSGAGGMRVEVGRDTLDKMYAAMDQMFGVQVDDGMRDVPAFTSIRAAYTELTGDTEVRGFTDQAGTRRLQAAGFDSSTFAYVLGNTLYRRMVQDYREVPDYGTSRLVGSNIRNARDFRSLQSVRIAYFGDLPDVNPENDQDYADLGTLSDEKVDYTLNQKGGILTISRKMIINDDMQAVLKIRNRLPRAARRTLAKRIWNLFINNGTYLGDNKAIFHADHGNLGSTAYGVAAALAAKVAMAKQTEPGSNERLWLKPVTIAFPTDLFGIVSNVNTYQPQAVTVDNANPMFNFFKPEGLVEVPFMTDVTDWFMFADPNECEIVELAFLNGQQEPEMFVADNPNFGQFFVGDRIQYKIRHEYECQATDFRGAYKAVVAG